MHPHPILDTMRVHENLPASLLIGYCCRQESVPYIAPAQIDADDCQRYNKACPQSTTKEELSCLHVTPNSIT